MSRVMSVIKAGQLGKPETGGLKKLDLCDVLAEARQVVADARGEAERILAAARSEAVGIRQREAELGRREGYEQGLEEGRVAGREQALADAKQEFEKQHTGLVQACQQIITEINKDRVQWKAMARQDLVELAMAVGRRVARTVGERDREVVLANLDEAIQLAGTRSEVTIAVSPIDAEAARTFAQSLMDMREHWDSIRVIEEPDITPGGCRVHWSSGAVDGSLETQLDRIENALRNSVQGGQEKDT